MIETRRADFRLRADLTIRFNLWFLNFNRNFNES